MTILAPSRRRTSEKQDRDQARKYCKRCERAHNVSDDPRKRSRPSFVICSSPDLLVSNGNSSRANKPGNQKVEPCGERHSPLFVDLINYFSPYPHPLQKHGEETWAVRHCSNPTCWRGYQPNLLHRRAVEAWTLQASEDIIIRVISLLEIFELLYTCRVQAGNIATSLDACVARTFLKFSCVK